MSLDRLEATIKKEISQIESEGRSKAPERIIVGYSPPKDGKGPRYTLKGQNGSYIKMNSNSYLNLAHDPRVKAAAHDATERLGVGPGAVRFIDGTYEQHIALEERLARFHKKEAAKIFSCAYMANLGLSIVITTPSTFYISDELNHNSIIRSLRIAGVKSENKSVFKHNNMEDLAAKLRAVPAGMERVVVIFDGVFSMRGDNAPMSEILKTAKEFDPKFKDGVITVVDESHGTAAYGKTGRGTPEVSGGENVDVITSTLGKGFGGNGGYIASSKTLIELVRQRADTYIYTNPVGPGDAAAGVASVNIVDSPEGASLIKTIGDNARFFRKEIEGMGFETIPGQHPIVPVLVRDTQKARNMVQGLFGKGIMVVGLTFPVVPKGDETLRVQMNASHTKEDLEYVIGAFREVGKKEGVIK